MHTHAPSGARKPQNRTLASRSAPFPANVLGNTNVSNTSLSAGLAGPGWPIFVAHCRAVEIGLSLAGGLEPNGSLDVTCSSHLVPDAGFCPTATPASATDPVNDGKLYSLLPSTASR